MGLTALEQGPLLGVGVRADQDKAGFREASRKAQLSDTLTKRIGRIVCGLNCTGWYPPYDIGKDVCNRTRKGDAC